MTAIHRTCAVGFGTRIQRRRGETCSGQLGRGLVESIEQAEQVRAVSRVERAEQAVHDLATGAVRAGARQHATGAAAGTPTRPPRWGGRAPGEGKRM
jgi:hypothetical protein